MSKTKDPDAPFKGMTVKQYMKKMHPDIVVVEDSDGDIVLVGIFCGFAQGPMTDTGCINVCPEYSGCDEAMYVQDLVKLVEGGQGVTWCDCCGDLIPESFKQYKVKSKEGKRFKTCSEACVKDLAESKKLTDPIESVKLVN